MAMQVADVKKPLASAVNIAEAGNRIALETDAGYIENVKTKERMMVRVENKTYVFDVQLEDGDVTTVTLDSGAGCHVWPRGRRAAKSKLEFQCRKVNAGKPMPQSRCWKAMPQT